jgi:hypothetical protein
MTAIRKEVLEYIDILPDSKLEGLKPILSMLTDDIAVIEFDLTDDEKEIIRQGREEYKQGNFIPLAT